MSATRSPKSRSSARKPAARRGGLPDERRWELGGLAAVALGVFLCFVIYLGRDGGEGGDGAVLGLRWLLGDVHYAVPVALFATGALLVLRPLLPSLRPFKAGALCLVPATFLILADGPRDGFFAAGYAEGHGGQVGELLSWCTTSVVGTVGTRILAGFLLLAGLLLVTGGSVRGVAAATSRTVRPTRRATAATRKLPPEPAPASKAPAKRRKPAAPDPEGPGDDDVEAQWDEPISVPEPEFAEPKVRRGPREQVKSGPDGFWEGAERYPDFFTTAPDAPPVDLVPGFVEDDEPPTVVDVPEPQLELPDLPEETEGLAEDPDEPEEGVFTSPKSGPQREVDPSELTPQGRYRDSVTDDEGFVWRLPDRSLLTVSAPDAGKVDVAAQQRTAAALVEALGHHKIAAEVTGMVSGPHITRYELKLAPGIKVSKVTNLKDDLAYALAAEHVRVLAPIPGKQAVGVEVPNENRTMVHLGDVIDAAPADASPLTVALGRDVAGRAIATDLTKMPHLLVAGTTGAGKSGAINAMLSSILLRATPHEVRLVLVDPKQVELNHYEAIPHLLTPVITNPKLAAVALQNLVREMESRYGEMKLAKTRSLKELNRHRLERGKPALPYILCVIDELADLMMVSPADVEDSIIRIAQKARAVGMHLVLATQSPRVDVITGLIKANVPSRIAFAVSSQTDSRVILDQNGAESLLGMGDMLFAPVGSNRLQRIQGAYLDEAQIEELTEAWRVQGEPELQEELLEEVDPIEDAGKPESESDDGFDPDEDPLLEEAIWLVASMQTASTSMLQRRLRLGYTRAGRLIDMLERRGVISGYEGSKPRQVLVSEADVPRIVALLAGEDPGPADGLAPPADPPAPGEDPDPGAPE